MAVFYRKLFFWVFVLLFLATTPAAILYSQGYRFDQYKRIFIHSGSVTVKSTPSNVNVYLDGTLQSSGALDIINDSVTLNGLRPGNYNLKISADGYDPWEKNIDVHSGVSTEFWNVFLAPQETAPVNLAADGAEKFFPSPFGKNIAYVKKNEASLEIWSLALESNEASLVFSREGLEFPNDPLKNAEWNSREKFLIVPILDEDGTDFLVLDSEKEEETFFLSQTVDLSEIDNARWSSAGQNEIYFTARPKDDTRNNLYRMDITAKQAELVVEGIRAYDLSSNSVYYLRQNDVMYEAGLNGRDERQLYSTSLDFSRPEKRIRLIAYDDSRQAVISESGELFVRNNGESEGDTLKKIADNAKSIQFSNDGKKLLYWNDNEINVLFLRKWDVQPRRDENEIQQIIRFSSPLKNVFWYRDYEHIFFAAQNFVKMIELDSRDRRMVNDIFKYNSEYFLSSYDSVSGVYYYIDETDGVKKMFFLYIPEQTNFFGG